MLGACHFNLHWVHGETLFLKILPKEKENETEMEMEIKRPPRDAFSPLEHAGTTGGWSGELSDLDWYPSLFDWFISSDWLVNWWERGNGRLTGFSRLQHPTSLSGSELWRLKRRLVAIERVGMVRLCLWMAPMKRVEVRGIRACQSFLNDDDLVMEIKSSSQIEWQLYTGLGLRNFSAGLCSVLLFTKRVEWWIENRFFSLPPSLCVSLLCLIDSPTLT